MKSVLISIRPKWCELIVSGQKTVEIRKTRPKLETPFRCYIYCTCSGITKKEKERNIFTDFAGKVIGEFVCDRIDVNTPDLLVVKEDRERATAGSCLTAKELMGYLRSKQDSYNLETLPDFYCWHISSLFIYDKPVYLGDFKVRVSNNIWSFTKKLERPPQSWCYVEELSL